MNEETKLLNEIIKTQEEALKSADEIIEACFGQIALLEEKIKMLESLK